MATQHAHWPHWPFFFLMLINVWYFSEREGADEDYRKVCTSSRCNFLLKNVNLLLNKLIFSNKKEITSIFLQKKNVPCQMYWIVLKIVFMTQSIVSHKDMNLTANTHKKERKLVKTWRVILVVVEYKKKHIRFAYMRGLGTEWVHDHRKMILKNLKLKSKRTNGPCVSSTWISRHEHVICVESRKTDMYEMQYKQNAPTKKKRREFNKRKNWKRKRISSIHPPIHSIHSFCPNIDRRALLFRPTDWLLWMRSSQNERNPVK